MKTGTVLLLGAAGLAVYYFEQLGVAGNTVQFVLNGISVKSLSDFQVQILVQNVSNASVRLAALSADITLNGMDIGNASFFPAQPQMIPGTSQQIVNIDVTPSILSLPGAIQNLLANPGGSYDVAVKGNANINSLVLPFSIEKTFDF